MKLGLRGSRIVLTLGLATACSQGTPPTNHEVVRTTGQAIQGGEVDTTHAFAVGICGGGAPGACQTLCSGALIAPNVVVTARHCIHETPKLIDCAENPKFGAPYHDQTWITTDGNVFQPNTGWHTVARYVVSDQDQFCGNDIALLVLEDMVPESEARPIIPAVQRAMTDSHYTRSFTAVGYGNTGPEDAGFTAGTRRIKRGIGLICPLGASSPCPSIVNPNEFYGGDGLCQGDSGSSAYEDNSFTENDGANAISFGVLSRAFTSADGASCEGSVYTRLDAFRTLVVDTVKSASKDWSLYPQPAWAEAVAPPESDAGTRDSGGPVVAEPPLEPAPTPDASTTPAAIDATDATGCSLAGSRHVATSTYGLLGVLALLVVRRRR
ncbi:hypothetical protein AKJ09_11441 [Labilithrix luteola]|uniref:Peptidase S1 domain-containing protein n=1 Tax=Labilithrix luteola TaxID=1391654 RepID=A0A0K1QGD2_9BACT|nr:trypsin-like serine protease [Labilithrix luteola]AKV04778.1 hypothetical protein AKJ09_11441 [Labilithrix luteola]